MQFIANQIADQATRRAIEQLIAESLGVAGQLDALVLEQARVSKWGTDTDYAEIEADGTIKFVGNATVWDDIRVPTTSTKAGGSKEPHFTVFKDNGSASQGVFLHWFDKSAEEELFFSVQMPHAWAGTAIYPHLHFVAKTDGGVAHRVRWGLEYTWAGMGQVFGETNILYANSAAALAAGLHVLTPFAAITPDVGQQQISSMLICRIFRDATHTDDDYNDDAGLLEVDFHYEIDTVGSREPIVK